MNDQAFTTWYKAYQRETAKGGLQKWLTIKKFTSAHDYVAQLDARRLLVPCKYEWNPSPVNHHTAKDINKSINQVTITNE